ncbi:uncharacterized protein N0V89_001295 [Didymosphaeria variabile]|uniref:AAA+ ATPase domain-containing protein n=1 Tax=Didymosphaeria variabile TaxID=1932322 RepID=A0A9W8XWW2_9PLEO|nr:uncharacterized protein N0V89_001295 [Didymosphaeria variabile]KAJ4360728.1 hypothetical protein N0V89_001295 [Didymosphaeria variabile]
MDALLAKSKEDSEGPEPVDKDVAGFEGATSTVTPPQGDSTSSKVPPPLLQDEEASSKASSPSPQEEETLSKPSPDPAQPPQPTFFPFVGKFLDHIPQRNPGESIGNFHKRKYVCEVERASMRDWRKPLYHNLRWPMPIIQAFYVQKPGDPKSTPSHHEGELPSDENGPLKNLQRICIYSDVLFEELLIITSISSATYPIMLNPPYKFLPDVKARIARLEEELNGPASGTALHTTANSLKSSSGREGELLSMPVEEGTTSEHEKREETGAKQDDMSSVIPVSDRRDLVQTQYLHLKCFFEFVTNELKDEIELRERVKMGTLSSIRFQDIWHLYQIGDMVYSQSHGRDQLYKVFAVTGGQVPGRKLDPKENPSPHLPPPPFFIEYEEVAELHDEGMLQKEQYSGVGVWTTFKVDCYKMAFDGVYCGPVDVLKRIRPYAGEREITSLPLYPVQFHPDRDVMTRKAEERGRKVLFGGGHKSYDGGNIALELEDRHEQIESDIYVDFDTYFQDYPAKKPQFGRFFRSKQNPAEVEENWPGVTNYRVYSGHEVDVKRYEDFMDTNRASLERFKPDEKKISWEHLVLLPPWVFGYVFQTRRWSRLDIELVNEMDRESDSARRAGFDDLVIDQRNRDLLVALVDNHASGIQRAREKTKQSKDYFKPTQIDLVRGKGQGLIILLHGPPGSGKTMFLRQLEYYAGILFLTTNRPGVLDEAFKSRIHISLRYPSIDLESTKTMWRNIMNRLEIDNKSTAIRIVFDKDALLDFATRHFEKCTQAGVTWNGRQIRNAFQTAIALGHYERVAKIRAEGMTPEEALATGKKKWNTVKLTKANFQKIARTASDFEEYIEKLRGNDSTTARDLELRDDDYDPHLPLARKQYPNRTPSRDDARPGQRKDRLHSSKSKRPVREEHSMTEEDEDEDGNDDLSSDSNEED